MRYLAHIIALAAVFALLGCEALQQPVACNSDLDCGAEQVCIQGECFHPCGYVDVDLSLLFAKSLLTCTFAAIHSLFM